MSATRHLPDLVEEAIARVRLTPPQRRLSEVMEALESIPGAVPFSELGVRCQEYEVTVGRLAGLSNIVEALNSIRPLSLAAAPTVVSLSSLREEEGDGVLIVRYDAVAGETLIPGPDSKAPFRADACRRFRAEMQALADGGRVHAYARGLFHWLVSSESGTILLERWAALRDARDQERREVLESIDDILGDRCQAVARGSRVGTFSSPIHEVFGAKRVLLPVVHPVSVRSAIDSIQTVVNAGCKGVFLINQGMTTDHVLDLVLEVRALYPTLWIGLNLLGMRPAHALRLALAKLGGRLDGLWTDNAGVDGSEEGASLVQEFADTRKELGWGGLYFGGVAFKYQAEVPADQLEAVTATASTMMDVVCTSGPGTGKSPEVAKVEAMRKALGNGGALAVASGVAEENVRDYLPHVDAFLVGTSIESSFGVLDREKVETLQTCIKNSRWA
jgi:hypothetical protein